MIIRSECGMLITWNKHTSSHIHQMILVFVFLAIQMRCCSLLDSSQALSESSILKMSLLLSKSSITALQSCTFNTVQMEDSWLFWNKNSICCILPFILINLLSTYLWKFQASSSTVHFQRILSRSR